MATIYRAWLSMALLATAACGPSVGPQDDGEWVVGEWYRYTGCNSFPCRHNGVGFEIPTAELASSGSVVTNVVSLCSNRPATYGQWSPDNDEDVRIEPDPSVEAERPFRWVGSQTNRVILRFIDECTLESEDSEGNLEIWKRGIVEQIPTVSSCEGEVVAGNSEAEACLPG